LANASPAFERWQLFHRLTDRSCAKVRRYVVDRELEAYIAFRNVEADPTARDALRSHGGAEVPALWDGQVLTVGAEALIARLATLLDIGRTPF
jgi:hypothetical protein